MELVPLGSLDKILAQFGHFLRSSAKFQVGGCGAHSCIHACMAVCTLDWQQLQLHATLTPVLPNHYRSRGCIRSLLTTRNNHKLTYTDV